MNTVLSKIAKKGFARFLVGYLCMALTLPLTAIPAAAAPGDTLLTPVTPMELPVEVEIELSPAGSLKQALLWKELYQLLKNPYAVVCPPDDPATPFSNENYFCVATINRRPAFQGAGVTLPAINIYSLGYNFLTAQPMRLRTSDGEVSWDQPGPVFDPAEDVLPDAFNTPTVTRTPIGHLVACPNVDDPATPIVNESYQAAVVPAGVCAAAPIGSLVVYNSTASLLIPPTGTVVAVSAYVDGVLNELDPATQELEPVVELEAPINEEDFLRNATDNTGVDPALVGFIGRPGAEVLGKALFWDMQVGSDGIQSCGTCHFHGGADNRTRNQLNPDVLGGGTTLTVKGANQDVVPSDFPFHKRIDPETPGDGTDPAIVVSDAPDVMSSMGVRFRTFVDIPPIAQLIDANTKPRPGRFNEAFGLRDSFIDPVTGLPVTTNPGVLPPDTGTEVIDPVDVGKTENFTFFSSFRNGLFADPLSKFLTVEGQNLRRVEPRNTPTFHGAAFNLDNFWDGRARFNFNGGSVFGPADPQFHVFLDNGSGVIENATHGHLRPDLLEEDPELAEQPLRIKFSSLASQSVGPPLSNFEMSFDGRNWAKIGKKMLQAGVTPLANQLVDPTDSVLGSFSNRGGDVCTALGRTVNDRMPGICVTYPELIQVAFMDNLWRNASQHLDGAPALCAGLDNTGFPTPPGCDPFDGYVLSVGTGPAALDNTNQFNQMEANFSLLFGMAVQAYEALVIADDTPADRFFDINPFAGHAVGEPGDQAVLFPTLIPDLIDDGELNGTAGTITLIPDNPATPEYDGFGPDEVFGFDIFAGANLTAALPPGQSVGQSGRDRNPPVTITRAAGDNVTINVGSNPFTRSAKCMLCHLGPEQTDHSINISHGVLKNDAEFEYPTPPRVNDPLQIFADNVLPAPEPSGSSRTVAGLILAEEVGEGPPQDAVEVEPRNFATLDDLVTPWDERIISQPGNFAFGDQGIYNIGLRPIRDDLGRGGNDPFGWPLSLSALTLKNIGGADYEPCDEPTDNCVMANFDPANINAVDALGNPIPGQQGFEETGDGAEYPGAPGFTLQSINPGFERDPILPQLPPYLAPFVNHLPAGELHPQIDEMAGMVPNTITPPNGGPGIEFPEVLFGADMHCAAYDPAIFGLGPPNFGWGPPSLLTGPSPCPQHQSGVTGNFAFPSQGTWPVANRVLRDGAFKAPQLRNVELTGPYFHTGSYLTLRQVVDFYFRGGDFPISNAENRDPHIVDIDEHAFSFGRTSGDDLRTPINFPGAPGNDNVPTHPYLISDLGFGDGLPDTVFLYDAYPDSDHPVTPEPVFASREAAMEDAKESLVKFLLALTDPRVKYERAPFDRPEIFVPVDGLAPDNIFGREALAADLRFRRIAAVGAAGNATPLPNFLGVLSTPCTVADGPACVSHFNSNSSGTASPVTAAGTSGVTASAGSASLAGTVTGSPIAMTVVAAIPPATAVTLAANPLGPLTAGTSVAWTATASGGLGPYEYEIWLWNGDWSIVKGYDELGNSWNWNTTGMAAGTYYVTVYARTSGSRDAGEVVANVIPFVLQ
jgi:hypothetical protein